MEGNCAQLHRQRALDSLTRSSSRLRSTRLPNPHPRDLMGHSVWSDTGSTRHITIDGAIDSRFNPVELSPGNDARPASSIPSPMPIPYFMAAPTPPTNAPWTPRAREPDMESQSTIVSEEQTERPRFSMFLQKPRSLLERLRGKGRPRIGLKKSLRYIVTLTWLNILLIFVPIAWGVHFSSVPHIAKFILNLLAIIPLSKLLDHGGEQLALYCGRAMGDLIIISLNNAVETTLALVLLTRCDLRLLQSTVVGVVLLRLLFVPGAAFVTGGVRVRTQELHPCIVHLNHSLLTMGALSLLLPIAYLMSLDHVVSATTNRAELAITDAVRGDLLKLSRALAIFLLVIYIGSRFYLHNPPGEDDEVDTEVPESFKADIASLEEEEPEMDALVCVAMLVIVVGMLAVTTEFLARDVHPVEVRLGLTHEYFGLIVLPFVSYAADGILSTVHFFRSNFVRYVGAPSPVSTLARGRSIDLAIQFFIFWMPFTIIIGWCTQKPISLLFNVFEVAVLLGACFLVNYVTADAKTNWAEGMMMITFYAMIAVTAFFYPGQSDVRHLSTCATVEYATIREHQLYTSEHQVNAGFNIARNDSVVENNEEGKLGGRLQRVLQRYNIPIEGEK